MALLIKLVLLCSAAFLLSAPAVKARDIGVILHRTENGTELFLAGQAQTILAVFDATDGVIPMTGHHVDFEAFRSGTWEIGNTLLEKSVFAIDEQPAGFEAMSFMLHPSTESLSFRTPMDGMIAIGVCNSAQADAKYNLNELMAYVGYYSTLNAINAPVVLKLPKTLSHNLTIEVSDFGPDGQSLHYVMELQAGEDQLSIEQDNSRHFVNCLIGLICGLLTVTFFRGFVEVDFSKTAA